MEDYLSKDNESINDKQNQLKEVENPTNVGGEQQDVDKESLNSGEDRQEANKESVNDEEDQREDNKESVIAEQDQKEEDKSLYVGGDQQKEDEEGGERVPRDDEQAIKKPVPTTRKCVDDYFHSDATSNVMPRFYTQQHHPSASKRQEQPPNSNGQFGHSSLQLYTHGNIDLTCNTQSATK